MNEPSLIRTHAGQPPIAILGVPFDNLTVDEAVELIARMVASRRPHYLVTADVDMLVQSQRDSELRRTLFEANLVLCDGAPLVHASSWLGDPLPERVLGPDLVPLLLRAAAEKNLRVVLLGDAAEAATRTIARIKEKYPDIALAGQSLSSGTGSPVSGETIRAIAEARADMLLVALGDSGVEKWISMNCRALNVPVVADMGDAVEFRASGPRRSSGWFSLTGVTNRLAFLWGVAKQWWQLQFRSSKSPAQVSTPVEAGETWQCIKLPARLDLQATRDDALLVDQVLADGRHCLLDLAAVEFIDSTGVGLLIRLQKKVRASGKQLVLLSPSANVQRALKLMNLQNFFAAAADLPAARELIKSPGRL